MKVFRPLMIVAAFMAVAFYLYGCLNEGPASTEYVLTVISDGNGTTDPAGEVKVTEGTATNITATAAIGYEFVNWTVTSGTGVEIDDAEAADTTVSLTSEDATIQANFSVQNLTIRARVTGAAGHNARNFYFAVFYEGVGDILAETSIASNDGALISSGIGEGFALDEATHATVEIFISGTSYDVGGYIDCDGDGAPSSGDYLSLPAKTVLVDEAEIVEFAYPADFVEVTDGTILLRVTDADAFDGKEVWSVLVVSGTDASDDANWLAAGSAPAPVVVSGIAETYMYNYPEATLVEVFDGGGVYDIAGLLKVSDESGVISGEDYLFLKTISVIGNTVVDLVFPGDFYLAP